MGLFDDFSKLHISIKSMLLSIISIIPFYFTAIYLFDYKILEAYHCKQFFINDFDVLFIFSLCFVLSLTWVVSNVFLSLAVSDIAEKMMKSNNQDKESKDHSKNPSLEVNSYQTSQCTKIIPNSHKES